VDRFIIQGGVPLEGTIEASGSKNAALPALAACLLTSEPVVLGRIPAVRDIRTMLDLLRHIGVEIRDGEPGELAVRAETIQQSEAPYELVKTMRASSLVLGPLLARHGCARVSLPGGCAIGARPINLHVAGLEQLGATIRQEHGYIKAEAPNGLTGAEISFDRSTVTGTEDLLMAAVLARGETVIGNAAREPEVVDLAELLNAMGAQIEGAGTSEIRIRGVAALHGASHAVIADRIEVGTFLIAGALTGGEILITRCVPEHLRVLIAKLHQAGAEVKETAPDSLRARARRALKSVDITTEEHPGFATDLQAQFMALMTQAGGISFITETIFENRFMHALELARMGANIRLEGRQAIVAGPTPLSGAQVIASDLRASASLVLAALAAHGEAVIDRVYHIDRGYEKIETKLAGLGARIHREASQLKAAY
jgi:UDP-N-acetylglucosamine 1-carboxyvinyltransferase